jgi:hypothetical protein
MKHGLEMSWSLDGDWSHSSAATATMMPGELVYEPEGDLCLKLKGLVGGAKNLTNAPSYPLMFGSASDVGPCTLVDTLTTRTTYGAVGRSEMLNRVSDLRAERTSSEKCGFCHGDDARRAPPTTPRAQLSDCVRR